MVSLRATCFGIAVILDLFSSVEIRRDGAAFEEFETKLEDAAMGDLQGRWNWHSSNMFLSRPIDCLKRCGLRSCSFWQVEEEPPGVEEGVGW